MEKITIILSILCIIITLFAWFSNTEQIFSEYGYSTKNLFSGKFYVLFTSIFLHSNLEHLLSNLLVLLIFGISLEEKIRPLRLLLLFFIGAFAGDLLSSLFYSYEQISIGASAGIFAIITATMLIRPVKMELVIFPLPLAIIALGYIIYTIIGFITNYPPHVAHIAHIGGAIVGLIYGFKVCGFRRALKIIIGAFILMLLLPFIWNLWVYFVKFILRLV